MANVGKITGTLENHGTSPEVEIGGAKWSICRNGSYFEIRCAVGDGTNALWNCTARGPLTAWSSIDEKKTVMWASSFDFLNTKDGYAHSQKIYVCFPRSKMNFEAEVEVIKLQVIDLSAPPNKSIESTEDGACFEVEGQKLWLSKKVLSVHSPFFEAMFSADFKEKATGCYALKEVDIGDFKRFLSVLYNLHIPISTQESLEGLLRLGDMWQCDPVLNFCHVVLSNPEKKFLTLQTKIELCDRHGFSPLLATIIEKAELTQLKALVKSGFCASLSSFTTNVIVNRLVTSW